MLRLRHYFLLVLLVFVGVAKSQNYPVQTFVQVSPPHTSYLPDYADPFSNQMKVLLTFTDFSYPSYNVKLRFKFEGNGYTITSGSLLPLPLFTITPGVPYEINGNDLAPYLATNNLVFSGINVSDYQTRKVLPEGPVTICVEVVDFSNPNQAVLSNPSCTPVWFSLNDPPLLNTPFCGNLITPADPQQLIFSWTPLHMNSINSAGTNYVFELFEIRPDNADPNQVVNSTLPIFMQVTDQTYINYGIVEPQLQVGMSYVWRVRAQDIAGRDFFRNNGYSAVCTFTYGNVAASLADGITLTLNSNGTGVRQGLAWWNASSTFTNYRVEVRKTGDPNYAWFPYDATSGDLKINGLEPNTNYECRVKGLIGVDYESEWSNISTFKTQAEPDYACGSTSLPGKSQVIVPLTSAIAGLYFTVGQFEMQVKSIEPVNAITMPGHYKGLGTIQIPFALLNLRVKFDDILVDENMMVRSGKVEAITQGIDAWLEGLEAVDPEFVDGVITDFSWSDSTSLTVWLDGEPQEFIFPESGVLVLQDEDGMKYTFNADGTWSVVSTLVYGNDVLAANKDYRIDFSADANQVFGFDQKKYAAWIKKYEVLLLTDSTNYFVPFKSLGVNEQDVVQANIKSPEVLNGVTFISDRNGVISNLNATQLNDTTYQVTLANINENSFVYAVHQGNRIGKLWVKALPKIEKEIVVVPVNGATLTNVNALTADLNKIYAQANVNLTVTVATNFQNSDWDLNNDNKLQNGDVTLMSHYSEEMRALRDSYFESDTAYYKKAYYLFVVPQFLNADLDGYMVRGKAVGFLKNGADAHTAAHELAHGIFNLEHTFPEVTQGITNNLLDYSENSVNKSHLAQHQWKLIHDPLPAFSFLDGEEDGEYAALSYTNGRLVYAWVNPESMSSYGFNSIYTPAGQVLTLSSPSSISKVSFDVLTGGVNSFFYNNVEFRAHYSVPTTNTPSVFLGYFKFNYWDILLQEYISFDEIYSDTANNFSLKGKISDHAEKLAGRPELYFTDFSAGATNDQVLAMVAASQSDCSRSIIKFNNQTVFAFNSAFNDLSEYVYPLDYSLNSLLESELTDLSPTVLDDEIFELQISQATKDLMCELIIIYNDPKSLARWHIDYTIGLNNLNNVYDLAIKSTTFLSNILTIAEAYDEFGKDLIISYGKSISNTSFTETLHLAFINIFGYDYELFNQPQNGEEYAAVLAQKIKNFKNRFQNVNTSSDRDYLLSLISYFTNEELDLLETGTRLKLISALVSQPMFNEDESIAIRLIERTKQNHVVNFLNGLRDIKAGGKTLIEWLIYRIDFSEYQEFWKVLLTKFQYSYAEVDYPEIQFFKYSQRYDGPDDCNEIGDCVLNNVSITNGKISIEYQIVAGCRLENNYSQPTYNNDFTTTVTEVYRNVYDNAEFSALDLYQPFIFLNNSESPIIGSVINATLTPYPVVPALFFKFLEDKEFEQEVSATLQVVAVTADIVTLLTGPGFIWKAYRATNYLLVFYEVSEVLLASANIYVNATATNSELVDAFNAVVGAWGIYRGGKGLLQNWTGLGGALDDIPLYKPATPEEVNTFIQTFESSPTNLRRPEDVGLYQYLKKSVGGSGVNEIALFFPVLASKFDEWAHLGLNYTKVDNVIKITAQNGDEIATVLKSGDSEILEISDDFFNAAGNNTTPINGIFVRTSCGENIIGAGFVQNIDGSIGFVEDVTSYGSQIVKSAIKNRGDLRSTINGIQAGQEAHHYIPIQLLKENDVVKKAVEGGFEFNNGNVNGIALDKYSASTGLGRHGPHPNYTNQIRDYLDKWAFDNPNYTPQMAKQELIDLVNDLENIINSSSGRINLLDLGL